MKDVVYSLTVADCAMRNVVSTAGAAGDNDIGGVRSVIFRRRKVTGAVAGHLREAGAAVNICNSGATVANSTEYIFLGLGLGFHKRGRLGSIVAHIFLNCNELLSWNFFS